MTAAPKFTPGPWRVDEDFSGSGVDPVTLRQCIAGANAVGVLSAMLPAGQIPREHIEAVRLIIGEWYGVPYAQFCRHPEKCAGKGSCPRDPCCCD